MVVDDAELGKIVCAYGAPRVMVFALIALRSCQDEVDEYKCITCLLDLRCRGMPS